jgi:hypothetical protein
VLVRNFTSSGLPFELFSFGWPLLVKKQKPAVRVHETAGFAILKNRIKESIEEILSEG